MKTAQEINDILDQVKLQGRFRRTPTDFVLVEVLLNLNARLAVVEVNLALEESRTERLNSRLENIRIR